LSRLLLTADRLLDGTGRSLEPGALLLDDGRIIAVDRRIEAVGAEHRHYAGATILPGLIDCHVHLTRRPVADPAEDADDDEARLARIGEHAAATLRAGVTTLRDCGGTNHLEMRFRELGAISPRLVLAGKIVSISTPAAEMWRGMYHQADGTEEVRRAVQEEVAAGADFIKVMATGAVMSPPGESPGQQQYSLEELQAAVEAAGRLERRVAAHAHGVEGLRAAAEAGVQSIEHGTMLHLDPEAVDLMARRGTFLVPTLRATSLLSNPPGPGIPDSIIEKAREVGRHHRQSVAAALAGGVSIAMGTDAATSFNGHGQNAAELELLVEAGMTPMQAIVASTSTAAAALDRSDELGRLAPGLRADLVVTPGDPLVDISVLQRPPLEVYLDGRLVPFLDAGQ
jgi:imidazolonepropionase-like amidohydrolase